MAKNSRAALTGAGATPGMVAESRSAGCAAPALLAPPFPDLLVMPAEQDLGHGPAPVLRRARVVRVLRGALQRGAEALLHRRLLVPQRPGDLSQDRVHQ